MRSTEDVRDDNNSWLWMKKGYLKKEPEGIIVNIISKTQHRQKN